MNDNLKELEFDEVADFIKNTDLKYKPNQNRISFPIITRIHRRYQQGHTFSEINILDGIIIDGHHRFISLSLLGVSPKTVKSGENTTTKKPIEWNNVELDSEDWDNWAYRKHYENRYDT